MTEKISSCARYTISKEFSRNFNQLLQPFNFIWTKSVRIIIRVITSNIIIKWLRQLTRSF